MSSSALFKPVTIGKVQLQHRVVHAPLTRYKSTKTEHVPIDLVKTYYSQRSSTPGTLLITEANLIAPNAGGTNFVPGLWSSAQINAWKEITNAVHANGSFIFFQLWALGRTAEPDVLESEGLPFIAPSAIPQPGQTIAPREMTKEEIQQFIGLYADAAKKAIFEAGFDGVEVHGANGFLPDQFLQDVTNHRTDEYGGSVEARSRFGLEVVDAIVKVVGEDRTAYRISPWSRYVGMGMDDPVPQFSHFVSALASAHPRLAYLHVIESRIDGPELPTSHREIQSNDFVRDIWAPRPLIVAGGFSRAKAIARADETGDLIAFGRHFLANPDLPTRLLKDIPLTRYNRNTFYIYPDQPNTEVGYVDYPFAKENPAN